MRNGPVWTAVSGGVVGDASYAVGATYPAFDARSLPMGWSGKLTELPRLMPIGGLPFQKLLTDTGNTGTYWHHRHHFLLPSSLLQSRVSKGYTSVRMYVVCASLVRESG